MLFASSTPSCKRGATCRFCRSLAGSCNASKFCASARAITELNEAALDLSGPLVLKSRLESPRHDEDSLFGPGDKVSVADYSDFSPSTFHGIAMQLGPFISVEKRELAVEEWAYAQAQTY